MTRHSFMDAQIERSTQGAVKATQVQPTPGPWRVSDGAILCPNINSYGNFIVCGVVRYDGEPERPNAEDQANAAFIVRAVNSHDALVNAAGTALDMLQECLRVASNDQADAIDEVCIVVTAALAKAQTPLSCPRCARPTAAFGLCAECAKEERGQP